MRRAVLFVSVVLFLGVGSVRGQTVDSYVYTTGIDSTLWEDMTYAHEYTDSVPLIDLGFCFFYCGTYHTQISIDRWGVVYFDRLPGMIRPFPVFSQAIPPFLAPYSTPACASQILWKVEGAVGSRTFVLEFVIPVYGGVRRYQVQLSEADGSIVYLYGIKGNTLQETYFQIGFKGENGTLVCVSHGHIASTNVLNWSPGVRDWPGDYRFYRFTPNTGYCGYPREATVMSVSSDYAVIYVRRSCNEVGYELFYRCADTGTVWQSVYSTDTLITIANLLPRTEYEYHVRSVCADSGRSEYNDVKTFWTRCPYDKENQIYYDNLYGDSVICKTGSFYYPSTWIGVEDYGPMNVLSRHTVHRDPSETDPRTNNMLHTVPDGRCCSVRLGNWVSGAYQESITYILKVDTNLYDLLILRYAIVEQQPNHPDDDQPKFLFKIQDTVGNLIDSCYYANFVAGMGDTVWRNGEDGVVWRDWTAVGIDLTPLQGQTIHVVLDNYDCAIGGHYGYAYFTMESGFKRLQSSYCGDTQINVFHAPKGFLYRWYSADNPSQTLSIDDSLMVTGVGVYKCRATFTVGDGSCGMTLTANLGSRFPMAAFTVVPMDTCGYSFRFENHSVVARDEAHTQLTSEPCEQYLWRFGDGTVSTAINPVHTFETGTYQVELLAMLANGQCRDSVSQTITVSRLRDTVYDTFCVGGVYLFYDKIIYSPGFYTATDGCWQHSVYLAQEYIFYNEIEDTICNGDTYVLGDRYYESAGEYNVRFKSVEGCDSVCHLTLSTRPLPLSNYAIDRKCHGNLYYYLRGRYREADSSLSEPGSVAFVGEDSLLYRWRAMSPSAPLPYLTDSGQVRIDPTHAVTYYLQYQYLNSPACPVEDTIELTQLDEIIADLEVSPEWLGYDREELTALDRSQNAFSRQWFVDGVVQDEEGPVLYYIASPDADSVVVRIVVYNNTCTDTAEQVVPILRHMLSFPNVFTPSRTDNNRFGPIGSHVTEYELWIYDRRGALVFHSTEMDDMWDGTCKGIPCKQESYAYTCHYTTPVHDRLTMTGTVTLLR